MHVFSLFFLVVPRLLIKPVRHTHPETDSSQAFTQAETA